MHLEVGTHYTVFGSHWEKVSVNGGAIALGHPVGWTGARITVTLLYKMMKRDAELGLATACVGGGERGGSS